MKNYAHVAFEHNSRIARGWEIVARIIDEANLSDEEMECVNSIMNPNYYHEKKSAVESSVCKRS
ncbi:MAG TPA: hypothetical protein PLE18_13985 [Candidatus Sumerlaeota bacterium]|nr:hypothetical protein [Candidatus Sumerlaeota bacterium]